MKVCFINEAGDLGLLNDPPQPMIGMSIERIVRLGGGVTDHLKPSADSQACTCPKASCCH